MRGINLVAVEKPCKVLGYCPYGSLVELFPPLALYSREEMEAHHERLKGILEKGEYRDEKHRKELEEMVSNPIDPDYSPTPVEDRWLYCNIFGHLCPAFRVAEVFIDKDD